MIDFESCLTFIISNMYADKTFLSSLLEGLILLLDDIEIDLDNLSKWMRNNKLKINANKSDFKIFRQQTQLKFIYLFI